MTLREGHSLSETEYRKQSGSSSKKRRIMILLLAAGGPRRLVRGFVFASLTADANSLFRLTVEGGRPCVPSAGVSYCLDVKCLRLGRFDLFNNVGEDGCSRRIFPVTRCSPVIAVHHVDANVWNVPQSRLMQRLGSVFSRSSEVARVTTKYCPVFSITSIGMRLVR